jgi:hypothetical protein
MITTAEFPEIAFVRVRCAGGPYPVGATLSVAFVTPGLARLAAHDESAEPASSTNTSLVPEMISASVIRGAGPYPVGASLTLSFIDPTIARIHPSDVPGDRRAFARLDPVTIASPTDAATANTANVANESKAVAAPAPISHPNGSATGPSDNERSTSGASVETTATVVRSSQTHIKKHITLTNSAGVRVRLDWNRDRVRRFRQVVDKLFTIDRLGWYRHVFAMRLLVPDTVTCGNPQADLEALRHVHALRAASIETLGRPLLAAFMPNFAVTPAWLDSLDRPAAARALAGLRETLLPHATDAEIGNEPEEGWTISTLGRSDLSAATASSVESLLPIFVPYESPAPALTEHLAAYRAALIDIFGQTTQSADAVRLNLMAQPNHTLDDRLRRLSQSVSESFGGLVVA